MIGSLRAYAASRRERGLPGGSLQAVQKARDTGRIQLTADGKVDFDAADAAWLANTSAEQQARGAGGGAKSSAVVIGGDASGAEGYLFSRARKEAALADLAEMQAAELRGELVRRDEHDKDFADSVLASRARFLLVAPMVAPKVAAPGRVAEAQKIIQDAIYEALNELSRMGDVAVDEAVESTAEPDGKPVGGSEPSTEL